MMSIGYTLLLLLVLALLQRTLQDKNQYAVFKKLKHTADRQKTYKRWVAESFLLLGGVGLVMLLLAHQYIPTILDGADNYSRVVRLKEAFSTGASSMAGFFIGAFLAAFLPVFLPLLRKDKNMKPPVIGDIEALLPRNRAELKLGAAMSVNAGIVEELFFRLGLPALLFGVFHSVLTAIVLSCIIFGVVHFYQGIWGIIFTTLLGVTLMAVYLASGNIFLAMLVHAILDLRSLVLAPAVMMYAQRKVL
jgi:membrane protease YdiL (CAAX protease family)